MAANSRLAVAIHTAAVLACHEGEFVTSGSIARSVKTNPVVVRRILCALTHAGLVESQLGKGGGSKLARKPADIKLSDIYSAVEDEGLFAVPAKPKNKQCPVSCCMKQFLGKVFGAAENAVRESLADTTLAEIVSTTRA